MTSEKIYDVKRRVYKDLLKMPGVHGVSVAYKRKGGERTETMSIRVYVDKKIAADDLEFGQGIPTEIDGCPTDVIERPRPTKEAAASADTSKYRPLQGGCQLEIKSGIYKGKGTLGCMAIDLQSNNAVMLTNQHVVEAVNQNVGHLNYVAATP